jgi:putative tryptophan/tyrosine transport system substrate-binding protein
MRRRDFLCAFGGAVTLPATITTAQQQGRLPLVGELLTQHSIADFAVGGFEKRLQELGWMSGSTIRIDRRVIESPSTEDDIQRKANELLRLKPDVLFPVSNPLTAALAKQTQEVPIVFVMAGDTIRAGFTDSLARPSRNITGFTGGEWDNGGKMVQFLKDIKPAIRHVAIMFGPYESKNLESFVQYVARTQQVVARIGVECTQRDVRTPAEIEATISGLGPLDGLYTGTDQFTFANRRLIIDLAARYRIPAIHSWSGLVSDGGLMSYSPDVPTIWRSAAEYVDRILKGAVVHELPIQEPRIYNLDINIATAKALGLVVPRSMLEIAHRIIE